MQQQTQQVLEKAVLESNNNVYCFKATSHLMDKNDEITHRGWYENSGMHLQPL
ncbi:hypothetical protein [Lysinibacillus xylanilyticus]|uniref:hypothetical protein n=1 Tax=Lysinibacillus xylanilyticus TaxID=582475 RepID=UPI003D063909